MSIQYDGERKLRVSEIQVDERLWGEGATERIHTWLLGNYDEATMPKLSVVEIKGKEGLWLLGWDNTDSEWDSLLHLIFGEEYADDRLARNLTGRLNEMDEDGAFGAGNVR